MTDKSKVYFDLPYPLVGFTPGIMLTSKIYPIVEIDEMTSVGSLQRMTIPPTNTDEMSASPTLVELTLAENFVEYVHEPEDLEVEPTLVEMELKEALVQYEHEPEDLEATPSLIEFTLKAVLVSYEHEPDEMEVTPTLVSLELQ